MTKVSFLLLSPEEYLVPYKVIQLKIQKYCTFLKATENITICVFHF